MHILISGVCGALGSRLAQEALSLGYTVSGLKRTSSNIDRIAPFEADIKIFNIDLNEEMFELENHSFDTLIHTITNYGRSGESALEMYYDNVQLPTKLLNIANRMGVQSFINCDTSLDRGHNNYSSTKAYFAEISKEFSDNNSIDFINAKLGTFFGDMRNEKQFTTLIIKKCLMNLTKIDLTHGRQQRDFIHIDDVVGALLFIIKNKHKYKFSDFYIGSGEMVSIREFSEQVLKITGAGSKLNFGKVFSKEEPEQNFDFHGVDPRTLGWKSSFTLEQGIRKTIDDYTRNIK